LEIVEKKKTTTTSLPSHHTQIQGADGNGMPDDEAGV
jgi:hypothetical protein